MKRILIRGITGSMGVETASMIISHSDYKLVAGLAEENLNVDLSRLTGLSKATDVSIFADLKEAVLSTKPDIMIDFTVPDGLLPALKTGFRFRP